MKLLEKDIKLVIFDLDGTLIDSTSIWEEIDYQVFKKRGYDKVPDEYKEEIVHLGLEKGAKMTIEKYGFYNDTVSGILKEWRDSCRDFYLHKIQLKPYAKELLDYLKENGVKLAIATANEEEFYLPCLKRLGVLEYFDYIMDIDKIGCGKSDPKIYNTVRDYFKVKNNETIILEDTLVGLTTANNAGYVAIGVSDKETLYCEDKKKENCFKYVYSFKELIE